VQVFAVKKSAEAESLDTSTFAINPQKYLQSTLFANHK
jgi:hypothetical protein